jgi:Flp pilus assembly pilin Flp
MNMLKNFIRDEQGQDLIEYTLLLAFVVLASAALFINAGGSIKNVWGISSNTLASAASAATPS